MKHFSKGFTFIELILVVALIAIIGATASPFLSNFLLRNNYETTTDKLLSSLRKAQQYSIQGKNNAVWGVCLSNNLIRLYQGSCSTPVFSEDFDVPATVSISGLADTTFSNLRGEPSGTLLITVATDIGIKTISLNAAGMIDQN